MGFAFYKKTFSKLSTSFILSFIISNILFKSQIFFMFSISVFGALYLLLGWLLYLKSDGLTFFKKKSSNKTIKIFNHLDRFRYKNKGVYNIDKNDNIIQSSESNDRTMTKISIYSYVFCGVFLLIFSQLFYYFF